VKTNLTLIGMPGAGKSTTGIILAKNLGLEFFDTDILIQINQQKRLQDILDSKGYLDLRKIEEQEILKINIEDNVISTGGSAVYSQQAMTHLQSISKMIFLKADFEVLEKRINNFATRGIAKAENQTFKELFKERQILYKRYADITIDCNALTQDLAAEKIIKILNAT